MTRFYASIMMGLVTATVACGGNEPTAEDHGTPASAKLFGPAGQELTPSIGFTRGQTVRVEVRFYAADGDPITGLEHEHGTALTFIPTAIATVAGVAGQKFFFDVTPANAAATGQLSIGFGHGTSTSEQTFGPYPVLVP